MSDSSPEPLLRFKCSSCGVSLGVDRSLAGVEGPCPRCGVLLTAPSPAVPKTVPSVGVTRSIRGGGPPIEKTAPTHIPPAKKRKTSPQSDGESPRVGERRRRSSKVAQPKRITDGDKAALLQFGKVVAAVIVGILIFLAVSYYLKNY